MRAYNSSDTPLTYPQKDMLKRRAQLTDNDNQ